MRVNHPNNQVKFGYSPAVNEFVNAAKKSLASPNPMGVTYDANRFIQANLQNKVVLKEAQNAFSDKNIINNIKEGVEGLSLVIQSMLNKALTKN